MLPTLMCMYLEGERTQYYLLDIWYVCRERTYTILFIIYVHTQVYLERDRVCDMTHSFICILVMHAFMCVPWWFMYAFIVMGWYIYYYRIHVVKGLFHTCDWIIQILGSYTHIKYYSVIYSSIHIHLRFFIMLNPYPRAWIWIIFSPYLYTCI